MALFVVWFGANDAAVPPSPQSVRRDAPLSFLAVSSPSSTAFYLVGRHRR